MVFSLFQGRVVSRVDETGDTGFNDGGGIQWDRHWLKIPSTRPGTPSGPAAFLRSTVRSDLMLVCCEGGACEVSGLWCSTVADR